MMGGASRANKCVEFDEKSTRKDNCWKCEKWTIKENLAGDFEG